MPRAIFTLQSIACADPQERGSDEIFVRYAFRERGQAPSFQRHPAVWSLSRGAQVDPAAVLLNAYVLPDKVYTFDLQLWEEDFGKPSEPGQGAVIAVRSLGLWNLVPGSSIVAALVGLIGSQVDPDDHLDSTSIDVYVPPIGFGGDGFGFPPGFTTPTGHALHVRTREYEYVAVYTVLLTP